MMGTHFRGNAALHIQDFLKIMSCIAPEMSAQHGYSLKLTLFSLKPKIIDLDKFLTKEFENLVLLRQKYCTVLHLAKRF